jgi:2-aminoethylphosphonate transport system permease protein
MACIAAWWAAWGRAVLVWSSAARALVWCVALPLFLLVYGLPLGVIALASIAGQWNDILPVQLTLSHYAAALRGESWHAMQASVVTGLAVGLLALACGSCAALALRHARPLPRRVLDVLFFMPSAVPSVSVGLALLVAFSRKPFLLNGTSSIVIVAHFVLVFAFTYGNVFAGLAGLGMECEQVAESLGARPFYRLRRITLPLLAPYLASAFSLSFALSMGELGATVMVYPPGWVTLPVSIFALSDRGAIFDAATLSVLLGAVTLAVLLGLSRLSARLSGR